MYKFLLIYVSPLLWKLKLNVVGIQTAIEGEWAARTNCQLENQPRTWEKSTRSAGMRVTYTWLTILENFNLKKMLIQGDTLEWADIVTDEAASGVSAGSSHDVATEWSAHPRTRKTTVRSFCVILNKHF